MIRTVLHLSDSNVFGGTERGILHLIAGLDRSCWRPVLLHHPDAPDALVTGATHAGAETAVAEHVRGKYDVGGIARLSFRMRQYDPAIVHAHLHWPLACKYGIAAAGLARVPVTVATAQLHLDLEAAGFVDLQHRLMTRRVDRYIAVSRHVAAGLERRFRVPPEKVTVIPNAVDLESLRNGAPLPPMGWPSGNGRWVALVLARLEAEKGVDVAIEAAARVPEIDLVIAGEGSLRATLEAHAATLGIPGRVFFLGHRSDTPALLSPTGMSVRLM